MRCQSDLLRAPLQMVAIGGLESGLLRNNNTSQRRWPGSEGTTGGSEIREDEQEKTFAHLFTQPRGDNTPPAPFEQALLSDRHDLQHRIMSWPPAANGPPVSRGHSSTACITLQPSNASQ